MVLCSTRVRLSAAAESQGGLLLAVGRRKRVEDDVTDFGAAGAGSEPRGAHGQDVTM